MRLNCCKKSEKAGGAHVFALAAISGSSAFFVLFLSSSSKLKNASKRERALATSGVVVRAG